MVKFFSISSGSNGNCYYIGNEETALLIDVGVGPRTLKKRLATNGIDINSIEFVLVTHDHADHIKGVGVFAEKYSVPVYATDILHNALNYHSFTASKLTGSARRTRAGEESSYKGVKFIPFIVPHDATETVGYFIDFYGVKFTFLTDLGEVTQDVINYCRASNIVIIEANYDIDMLLQGSYSTALKNRILNGCGHLSNDQTASVIKQIYNKEVKSIFLCHLSENNNTPNTAYNQINRALASIGVKVGKDITLACLPRRRVSEIYEIKI